MAPIKRDKLTILIVGVVLIGGLIAAEWYWFDYRVTKAEYELEGIGPLPEVSNLAGDEDARIIECHDPEVGKFYTDAESCEEAEPPDPSDTPPPARPEE